jgi:membrane glycosyltransferase
MREETAPESVTDISARYLDQLPLDRQARQQLLARIPADAQDAAVAIRALREALAEDADTLTPTQSTTPPLQRSSMAPAEWPPSTFGKRPESTAPPAPEGIPQPRLRRLTLLVLAVAQTFIATNFMREVLPYHGGQALEVAVLALFAILFLWVSAGFWTAIMGFVQLLFYSDRHRVSRHSANSVSIPPTTRTAIVIPICNEDVARVFAGLQATYRSLAEQSGAEQFDFYIVSDSSNADCRVAELVAWFDMCRLHNGFGRIFYRWRRHRINRKSGNVADFCRRWGKHYDYMVVLDADSVMSGDCLTTLVRLMEANPNAGIIQTAPCTTGRDTLYARMQQFSSRVYGPLFVAGLYYWQLGESHYWGHNAIIRVAPFMRHCALGRLPGSGALAGSILSHDFVEAALMRRAGWAVWIAYDLTGSYEESPPTLVDDLKRDRRWCYGNLMNFRLFPQSSFHPVHRAVFVTGAFSYISSPLWFLSLLCSTAMLATHTLIEPEYFTAPNQLFPIWPEWNPDRALALFSVTAALLFVPKLLSFALIALREPAQFGGRFALAASMLVETVFSALMAPIRMIFHTQFVCAALLGRSIGWKSPLRADDETGWGEALNWHGLHMLLGIGWAAGVYYLNPSFLWWLLPITGAWMLSIPISVYSSRRSAGRLLRKMRLLLIPEEIDAPRELRWTQSVAQAAPKAPDLIEAAVNPMINALICKNTKVRQHSNPEIETRRSALVQRSITIGPSKLSTRERAALLDDPIALFQLHVGVWSAPDVNPGWQTVTRATPNPVTGQQLAAPIHRLVPCS